MPRARPLLPSSWRPEKELNKAKKLLVKRQSIFQKIPTSIVKKLKLLPKDNLKWPWLIGGLGKILFLDQFRISFKLKYYFGKIAIFLINFIAITYHLISRFSYQFQINFHTNFNFNFKSISNLFLYQFSGWAKTGVFRLLWAQRPNRKTEVEFKPEVVYRGSNPQAAGSAPESPRIPKRGPLYCENAGK